MGDEVKVCEHKLEVTNDELSPYWVRLTQVCKKCKEEVVTLVDRAHFYGAPRKPL